MAIDVQAEINSELQRASTPKASRKPVFLFLSKGQKALIRPLFNLDNWLVLMKHNKWSDNRDYRVNAICAKEAGKPCQYCELAADDKTLTASKAFMVPVYVYQIIDIETGQKLTYKDPDTQEEKPVSGFRVLELTAYGKVGAILKTLNSEYRDEDEHDVTIKDFSIEQVGEGKKKDFITLPKSPKPINPRITEKCPLIDGFRTAILEACPPLVSGDDVAPARVATSNSDTISTDEDEIAVF